MQHTEPHSNASNQDARLVDAILQLDQKLGAIESRMAHTESNIEDFQLRWQVCSENITAQLAQVEQELSDEPTRTPRLRLF